MKKITQFVCLFLGLMLSTGLYAQVNADIVVDINGSGDFTTLQAAINSAPSNSSTATIIYIKRGLYNQEKLIVPANKINITLVGESREETIISYDIYNCADGGDGMCPDEKVVLWDYDSDLVRTAATLTIKANDFKAENLTIANTAGPVGQAQALTLQADRNVFINCNIEGYQDTIYFWMDETSRAYFKSCMILGRTDYIYGRGVGFFDECEIRSFGGAWITAPSTTIDQDYGFVFYKCDLTYQDNSPRNGDDGALIRFGRPWHEYPKVAWLYCNMTDKIHPEGWGDKWRMEYSDTSTDLHLYEWMNTGSGADMSGRANWAGLRAINNQTEADLYEADIVLAGSDNWNPTTTPPSVTIYNWDGGATGSHWMDADNWNPDSVPTNPDFGNVDGNVIIEANGGTFPGDLNLSNNATLNVTANSIAQLITLSQATISSASNVSLSGNIKTKGEVELDISGNLELLTSISGVHSITKKGTGVVVLNNNNSDFYGDVIIENGTLEVSAANAFGNAGKVTVKTDGQLTFNNSSAILTTTPLYTEGNATLVVNEDITISEWYVDGVAQTIGTYNATSNPSMISGSGSIMIGRPNEFTFSGGNWDDINNFSPALLPESGENVIVDGVTIEAQSSPFLANMTIQNAGSIRLRKQDSEALGTITMHQNTNISYATSGTGFYLKAPIVLEGDISLFMNSANISGSVMDLPGTFNGDTKITVRNTRDVANSATVNLGGNNSEFNGVWDLTIAAANAGGYSAINGLVENAFGNAKIELSENNQAIFNHVKCAGATLDLSISGTAKAVFNVDVVVTELILNGNSLSDGVYDASTHPAMFTGTGSIEVNSSLSTENIVFIDNGFLKVVGSLEQIVIYNPLGQRVYESNTVKEVNLSSLKSGIYIVRYKVDGKLGSEKIYYSK